MPTFKDCQSHRSNPHVYLNTTLSKFCKVDSDLMCTKNKLFVVIDHLTRRHFSLCLTEWLTDSIIRSDRRLRPEPQTLHQGGRALLHYWGGRKRYFPSLYYYVRSASAKWSARRIYLQKNCLYYRFHALVFWGGGFGSTKYYFYDEIVLVVRFYWCRNFLPAPSAVNSPLTLLHRGVCLRLPALLSPGSSLVLSLFGKHLGSQLACSQKRKYFKTRT